MVAKLSRSQYSPALFDVAQDIAGGLPLRLVDRWLASEQTQDDALHLLAGSRVTGFNVVSDAAGLTRLTHQRGLMEILAIINQPKEIIHGLGVATGGEAIGIWAADNTQMASFGITYLWRQGKEGWKLAVMTVHDPSKVLPLA